LAANPAPGWTNKPEHRVDLHPDTRHVKVTFGGAVIADSTATLRCEETGHGPVYYVPAKDMRLAHQLLPLQGHRLVLDDRNRREERGKRDLGL
jgi:uncharacterized protein (DUF427 family)